MAISCLNLNEEDLKPAFPLPLPLTGGQKNHINFFHSQSKNLTEKPKLSEMKLFSLF